jgi:DNA-binding NarL/FixJ family response regulator
MKKKEQKKEEQHATLTVNKTGIDKDRTRIALAKTLKQQARTRTELAKTRREQAKTRVELAKTRTEQTKTRVEMAKTRRKKSEIRAEQVEKTLRRVVHKEFDMHHKIPTPLPKQFSSNEFANENGLLEKLTNRQREILSLIAESQNTKQIGDLLKISPKTVEYHRNKLMAALNLHDIPGLVRFSLHAGLISTES